MLKKKLKTNVTTLALAWVIKNPNVSTMLLGASKASQLEENVKCLSLARELTPLNLKEIDDILGNKPDIYRDSTRKIKKTF